MHRAYVLDTRRNDVIVFHIRGMRQMHSTLAFWTMGMHHDHVLDTRGHDVIVFYIHGMLQTHATLSFWTLGMHHAYVLDTWRHDVIVFYIRGMRQMHSTPAFLTMGMHHDHVLDTRGHGVIVFYNMRCFKCMPRSHSGQRECTTLTFWRRQATMSLYFIHMGFLILLMHATFAFWTMRMHHAHVLDTRRHDVIVCHIHEML